MQIRSGIDTTDRTYAEDEIKRLLSVAPGTVLFARVDLTMHEDPARERPAYAQAELDVEGRLVRAHVTAATMHEAIDLLEARLRVRLERAAHREESKHLRHRGDGASKWHHGDLAATRPSYFPRPVDEREIVRRKTSSAIELLDLADNPFLFFLDPDDGRGRVLYRRYDGNYGLIRPN